MAKMGKQNLDESKVQKLLERYLKFQSATANSETHLDQDTLNSFVEGRLNRLESTNILNHLVRCSFCLHITAELLQLESEVSDVKTTEIVTANKPEKISEVLSGLLSKIFGTSDNAVFAHQEDKDEDNLPKKETDESK